MKKLNKLTAAMLVASSMGLASQASAIAVDLELALLIDVSGSVDGTEYQLQLDGYGSAFRSTAIQDAIAAGAIGSIAVETIFWSGESSQQVMTSWVEINDATSANTFADTIEAIARPFQGWTAPGSALNYALGTFTNNYEGTRNVIDVSGDGKQNRGFDTSDARDAALAGGIDTINGITIGNESGLNQWYVDNLIGGTNAFAMHATDFTTFGTAISNKLVREITGTNVPEPAPVGLLSLGLFALAYSRRKSNQS